MVDTDPNVITLQADDDSYQAQTNAEADGVITPGQIIENSGTDTTGANNVDLFQRVSTSAENIALRIALAYVNTGKTIDDDYADGDSLRYRSYESGDRFYGLVFDGTNAAGTSADLSANANISKGDRLVAYAGAGENGNFRKLDTANGDDEAAALVEAKEAVDNSSGSSPARIELEVL